MKYVAMLLAAAKSRYSVKEMIRHSQHQVGATAVEYCLIAAGIAVAIIAVVNGLGSKIAAALH